MSLFQSREPILSNLMSISQSVIQSQNHFASTAILSCSLVLASPRSHVFSPLHTALRYITPLLGGGHLWDGRDCTSTLPFRLSLPRMLQLCDIHGRVWSSLALNHSFRGRVEENENRLFLSCLFLLSVCIFLFILCTREFSYLPL